VKVITRGVIDWATLKVEHVELFEYHGPVAQCGSLAFAVGGALAGAGQGLAEVGNQAMKEQRDAKILQLQAEEAARRQQAGFGEQEKLQAKTQAFEHTEKEREYQVGAAAAGAAQAAKLAQIEAQNKGNLAVANVRGTAQVSSARLLGTSRVAAAGVRADNTAANKPKPLFKDGGYYTTPGTPAMYGQPATPGRKVPMIIGPGGQRLIQVGPDKYAPFDPAKPLPSIGTLPRAPQADVQDAAEHPERIMPFLNKYGWVSAQHVQAGLQHSAQPQSQPGVPSSMPRGTTYTPPPAEAGTAEDNEDERGVFDPYGETGPPTSQPSDSEPAQ